MKDFIFILLMFREGKLGYFIIFYYRSKTIQDSSAFQVRSGLEKSLKKRKIFSLLVRARSPSFSFSFISHLLCFSPFSFSFLEMKSHVELKRFTGFNENFGFEGGGGWGGWSVVVLGLYLSWACSFLQPWHHRSIPFHGAGTTETPITLLIC